MLCRGMNQEAKLNTCTIISTCTTSASRLPARRRQHFGLGLPLLVTLTLFLVSGCASTVHRQPSDRRFVFGHDSFAYANELLWEYEIDPATGKTITRPRVPKPEYRHYCFVMARAVRVFFDFAEFAPGQPRLDDAGYRQLVREVLARNARADPARQHKIIIPGYANLREFSRDHEALLKAAGGGNWQSFVQRGHWRIVFPFSRRHQAEMADRLRAELCRGVAPVIHVVLFPEQTINHALLVYGVRETAKGLQFSCYDPNDPGKPLELSYEVTGRQFRFPATKYFSGGAVDVNEVYRNWLY